MIKYIITLISLAIFSPIHLANAADKNFYIEIKDSTIEIGNYINKWYEPREIQSYRYDNIDLKNIRTLILPDSGEKTLFYFHSFLGGTPIYHNHSLIKLNELDGIDRIVSIVWHTDKLTYKGSWKHAINQGQKLSPMFQYLLSKSDRTSILCHSMGHRIFEGIISNITPSDSTSKQFSPDKRSIKIENVIFAAADLDIDVFQKKLHLLPNITDKITLYLNSRDRALQLSSMRLKRERLGLDAGKHLEVLMQVENLEIVDVSTSDYDNIFSISQHIYFKNNPVVLRDIECVLNRNHTARKKYVKSRRENFVKLK